MSSFLPFSISAPVDAQDDAHLEVTVTPRDSAFYAGETFSAVIKLRNTRQPSSTSLPRTSSRPESSPSSSPSPSTAPSPHGLRPSSLHRLGQIGLADAGPSRPRLSPLITPDTLSDPAFSNSPGTAASQRADGPDAAARSTSMWNVAPRRPSGIGHSRRSHSLALEGGILSSQEMIWSLGGGEGMPPPLPIRKPPRIPQSHPHARKVSLSTNAPPTSPPPESASLGSPQLDTVTESQTILTSDPSLRRSLSSSPSYVDDDTSSAGETGPSSQRSPPPEVSQNHRRSPSYHNAYGTLISPPPVHPSLQRRRLHVGTTTVLWAHTRLVARFSPSNAYIPPDPLLPLRAMLLHQPVGSGSLMASPTGDITGGIKPPSSRWQISFGTGTIGNATQPSLTGSLFGLAKGLVYGGSGGSLEEEHRRVWNAKDLPVLETTRTLLGVDMKLSEGESKEFVYSIQLPSNLPPAFRGKALRFSYELVITINVSLPGGGKRQRSKEIAVPIRVWANVSVAHPIPTYDVLQPVIQTTDQGTVSEKQPEAAEANQPNSRIQEETLDTLSRYASHLLETLDPAANPLSGGSHHPVPESPSRPHRAGVSLSPDRRPGSPLLLGVPNSRRSGQGSFVAGDDELVEGDQETCGQAVEILSRHSPKSSYDISKDGHVVAVLTLIKTTYRLGETVLGVVTFNDRQSERRVLKFSAYLETHEIIPEPLLPPSANSMGRARPPELTRVHAEHRAGYALHTSRASFSLDIPSDATPAFALAAGHDGKAGGLEWRVRLTFLVSSPPAGLRDREGTEGFPGGVHLVPFGGDADNAVFTASTTLMPVLKQPRDQWIDTRAETVECEVPVQVLAGNTAYVIRPSVFKM